MGWRRLGFGWTVKAVTTRPGCRACRFQKKGGGEHISQLFRYRQIHVHIRGGFLSHGGWGGGRVNSVKRSTLGGALSFDRVYNSSSSPQCEIHPPCNSYNLLEVKAASSSKHVRGGRKLNKYRFGWFACFFPKFNTDWSARIQKETQKVPNTINSFWVSFSIGPGSIGGISERIQEPIIEPDLSYYKN